MRLGGIILCGGRSSRMGQPKALLPFGNATMLECVIHRLSLVVNQIAVVAAADQQLPALPTNCTLARDEQPDRGPLEGLRVGLTALANQCDVAYVTACDAPMLMPEFVTYLTSQLGNHDAVVSIENGLPHSLSAIYRTSLGRLAQTLLEQGESRLTAILDAAATKRIDVQELRDVDPDLLTLRNLNTPKEYQQATQSFGY